MVEAAAAGAAAAGVLDFLVGPINCALSAGVWKRPCPNFDDVSMNFSSIFSKATRLALVTKAYVQSNVIKYVETTSIDNSDKYISVLSLNFILFIELIGSKIFHH